MQGQQGRVVIIRLDLVSHCSRACRIILIWRGGEEELEEKGGAKEGRKERDRYFLVITKPEQNTLHFQQPNPFIPSFPASARNDALSRRPILPPSLARARYQLCDGRKEEETSQSRGRTPCFVRAPIKRSEAEGFQTTIA